MLNELFTKFFFAKPTTYCGNKSLVLNFDDDAEKFTVIQLSQYTSYNFYIKEESKKKYYLCFEGVLLSGESETISIEFDDEDDAEKAIKQVLVSLNGKTKVLGKITLNIIFVFVLLFASLGLLNSVMAFFAPVQPQLTQLQLPPFAMPGANGQSSWGLPLAEQEAMAKANAANNMTANGMGVQEVNKQYQEDLAKKMMEAQQLMNSNLDTMRDNRDIMVNGGNPYVPQQAPAQVEQEAPKSSSSAALINALQGK